MKYFFYETKSGNTGLIAAKTMKRATALAESENVLIKNLYELEKDTFSEETLLIVEKDKQNLSDDEFYDSFISEARRRQRQKKSAEDNSVNKKDALTPMGVEIKKAMIDKGLSHTELATKIGTSCCFLGHIMHGRKPGRMYIPLIAAALGIDLSRFEEQEAAS